MKQNKGKIQSMVLVGVCTAIIVVLSQIAIPLPSGVPITLQTFAVALCGYLLGVKRGLLSTALYIAMGAIGLPVFAGFTGGAGMLVSYRGGFIWGFLLLTLLCGLGTQVKRKPAAVLLGLLGLACLHLLGMLQFAVVTGRSIPEAFVMVTLPFLVKDAISICLALGFAAAISYALKKSGVSMLIEEKNQQ